MLQLQKVATSCAKTDILEVTSRKLQKKMTKS